MAVAAPSGRGGAPAHQAILPTAGILRGGLRVTEQGEMIRFKFGLPKVAFQSLNLYTSAVLEGNLLPPPRPKESWRAVMEQLATVSCDHYRSIVRGHPDFVPYFRAATPEMGARQAAASVRAPPSASPTAASRACAPSLDLRLDPEPADAAGLARRPQGAAAGHRRRPEGRAGRDEPPVAFFRTRLEMLEMVFLKADLWLAEYYDTRLVPENLWALGRQLRQELADSIQVVLETAPAGRPAGRSALDQGVHQAAQPYTDPLNVLQVELLSGARATTRRPCTPSWIRR